MAICELGSGGEKAEICEKILRAFLTVKTLDASRKSDAYARTRQFYLAMGFVPLEVFPLLWDESNPCLFMAKHLCGNGPAV